MRAAYLLTRDVILAAQSEENLEHALSAVGVREPKFIAERAKALAKRDLVISLSEPGSGQAGAHIEFENPLHGALFSIFVGGTVSGVPTPECMKKHLPKGRKPTAAEIEKAYKACRK